MTSLFRKPVGETATAGRIAAAGALAFATMAVLALIWWSFSPILGRVYAALRLAETAFLWKFTGWGTYFTTMPAGEAFAFVSIYKSSVPFGVAATLLTMLLGTLAWRKRTHHHMEVLITAPAAGFSQPAILEAFAPPDRLVRRPDTGAIESELPAAEAEAEGEAEASEPPVPPVPNVFKDLRDLRNGRAVEAVADSVPWHLAAALALAIDALAPLKDRNGHTTVLKAAWKAADAFAADPAAEPPAAALLALRGHMFLAITDLAGRDVSALDRVHAVLGRAEHLQDAVAELATHALAVGRLRFPDYAWLRHVDPTLQSAVTSY